MKRHLLYAQLQKAVSDGFHSVIDQDGELLKNKLESEGVLTFSLFKCGFRLGIYMESVDNGYEWDWPSSYQNYLEEWPGEKESRFSVPMIDIYHDGVSSDPASWRGDRLIEKRVGSFAKLKPEMAASYIFYHYQMQEEKPESFNKTYTIGLWGSLLFSYYEWPASLGEAKPMGLLSTNNTPENWHAVMQPHFLPWEHAVNDQEYWQSAEFIYGF